MNIFPGGEKALVAQPCLPLCDSVVCPWNSPGKNAGVGCHFLLQGIFLTQGSNPHHLHWRQILHCLSYQGYNPFITRNVSKLRNIPAYGILPNEVIIPRESCSWIFSPPFSLMLTKFQVINSPSPISWISPRKGD